MEIGFHGDQNLIEVISESLKVSEYFVELGTGNGRSLSFLASKFPDKRLRSCEIDRDSCEQATERCKDVGNVRVFNMDSVSFLESFWVHWHSEDESKRPVFWVDLENGKDTGYESPFTEVKKITQNFDRAAIFIDDFKVPYHFDWFQNSRNKDREHSLRNFQKEIKWHNYFVLFPDYEKKFEEMYHLPVGWALVVKEKDLAQKLEDQFGSILNCFEFPIDQNLNVLKKSEKFEFTTTACVRPELLSRTYQSLNKSIVDFDTRKSGKLYINIDPVPVEDPELIKKELKVANRYFSEVCYNVGERGGSFPKAAKWVFAQPETDYFFHVEDDWIFDGVIPIQEYIRKMEEDKREDILQCVTYQNGGGNRVHFPPSIFKTVTLSKLLNKHPIPKNKNPEEHIIKLKKELGLNYNVTSHRGVDREDLGREWADKRGIKRNFDGNSLDEFVDWDLSKFDG